jgi:hypothetical protein
MHETNESLGGPQNYLDARAKRSIPASAENQTAFRLVSNSYIKWATSALPLHIGRPVPVRYVLIIASQTVVRVSLQVRQPLFTGTWP